MPEQCYYFYRLNSNGLLTEFCVSNARDPNQYVESMAPDGSRQVWESHDEGDLIVFNAPDGYDWNQGLLWAYDNRIQIGQAMPREELERYAMRHKVSSHANIRS